MEEAPPLSFPAIIRNPGLVDRFAHLDADQQQSLPATVRHFKREHYEGKRWVRRKDNARFTGNPHIVVATKNDYALQTPQVKATFPEPLPPYLSRNTNLPSAVIPARNPTSANAGRFSLSLKGMRRALRKSGCRAEALVREVEHEVVQWLQMGGTLLQPDNQNIDDLSAPGVPIGSIGTVFEVSRTPLQLIWYTDEDNFARYVIHCCARYHEIVSFSKDLLGRRLTYLLRPNVTRPDHHAPSTLDTPPITDVDYSSHPDTESDRGTDSDIELQASPLSNALPAISENLPPSPPGAPLTSPPYFDGEAWAIIGDTDVEGGASDDDSELAVGVNTLSLVAEADSDLDIVDNDRTPRAHIYLRQQASLRRRVWAQGRAPSSPSRSPARRSFRRGPFRFDPPRSNVPSSPRQHKAFYDYLFS